MAASTDEPERRNTEMFRMDADDSDDEDRGSALNRSVGTTENFGDFEARLAMFAQGNNAVMGDIKAAMAKVQRAPSDVGSDELSLLGSQYSQSECGDDDTDTMTVATEAIADDLSDDNDTESVGYATTPRASNFTSGAPSTAGLGEMSDLASERDPRARREPSEMGTEALLADEELLDGLDDEDLLDRVPASPPGPVMEAPFGDASLLPKEQRDATSATTAETPPREAQAEVPFAPVFPPQSLPEQPEPVAAPATPSGAPPVNGFWRQGAPLSRSVTAPGPSVPQDVIPAVGPPVRRSVSDDPDPAIPRPGERPTPGDGSLLPVETDVAALWKGWTCVASPSGRLFYYHTQQGVSQWHQPPELLGVIGDWRPVQPADGSASFWYNRLLGISLWNDPTNTTNIFQAALDGNTFFLHLYNEVGGSLDVQDPKGRTCLHYACAGGSIVFVDFLITQRVDVSVPDSISSTTPLLLACRYGHAEICQRLLDAGARTDERNDLGDSALHEAAQLGQVDCISVLLAYNAPVRPGNAENRTPEAVAALGRHGRAVQLLQAAASSQSVGRSTASDPGGTPAARWDREPLGSGGSVRSEPLVRRPPARHERRREEPEFESDSDDAAEKQGLGLLAAVGPALQSAKSALGKIFPTRADLGVPNAYVYDEHRQAWTLRDDLLAVR